ncbi:MAG: hypothetical protein V4653_02200, partial [Pseudomonadota bacterium]
ASPDYANPIWNMTYQTLLIETPVAWLRDAHRFWRHLGGEADLNPHALLRAIELRPQHDGREKQAGGDR